MSATFRVPERIVTGAGCIGELPGLVAELGRRALLVTGAGSLRRAGVTDRIMSGLAAAGVETTLFESPGGEPTIDQVDAVRQVIADFKAEAVVAIGGGSPIDLAKAAAGLGRSAGPTRKFFDGAPLDRPGLPLAAAPTTSGTAPRAWISCTVRAASRAKSAAA